MKAYRPDDQRYVYESAYQQRKGSRLESGTTKQAASALSSHNSDVGPPRKDTSGGGSSRPRFPALVAAASLIAHVPTGSNVSFVVPMHVHMRCLCGLSFSGLKSVPCHQQNRYSPTTNATNPSVPAPTFSSTTRTTTTSKATVQGTAATSSLVSPSHSHPSTSAFPPTVQYFDTAPNAPDITSMTPAHFLHSSLPPARLPPLLRPLPPSTSSPLELRPHSLPAAHPAAPSYGFSAPAPLPAISPNHRRRSTDMAYSRSSEIGIGASNGSISADEGRQDNKSRVRRLFESERKGRRRGFLDPFGLT
ncbi:uncharacterized protein EV422DRAFT_517539 [Fimicolochytrium jonesii]|uniref:uncharacterized protein n=1 Tax=Fimicolochytrium jonesii TaxID=1396493 RepID=UPI0022FE22DB|nr:uncharacterized protein EV422DRAFT_517539 [Fimicolochytrium jonesii]KAI8825119.1 hypothetical protein EV422DRAFT_517539 [Fimicolochytrium jonesii]